MVVVELREELAAYPKGGLAPGDLLSRLGQRQADRPQALEGPARTSRDATPPLGQ